MQNMKKVLSDLIQIERTIVLCQLAYKQDFSTYSLEEIYTELQRREALKPKPVTVEDQLKFILANDPEEQKYDIEKIFENSFCKALTAKLPYTHFFNGSNCLVNSYKIIYTNSIDQEVTRFENFVSSDLKVTIEEFTLYAYFAMLLQSYYFRQSDKPGRYLANGYYNSSLCQLIQFLVNGIYEIDYQKANEFLDSEKIGYDSASYQYTIGNIIVKTFIIGRIDIKGLTANQEKVIERLFLIHEKLRNK